LGATAAEPAFAQRVPLQLISALDNGKTCSKLCLVVTRSSVALLLGFTILSALSGRADEVLPPRFNFDRYTRMTDHSPFAVATAVALPETTPDFAKDLYVANAAHSSEGDMATIMSSSDQNFKKYLNTKEPVDGYSIASIEWSEKVGETKVTISKDGKFATLTFNQALLSQAVPPGPAATGEVPQIVPFTPSPRAGQASRARSRGVIKRNPKAVAAAASTPTPTPDLEPSKLPPRYEHLSSQQLVQKLEQEANEAAAAQVLQQPDPQQLLEELRKRGSDRK
jgi:hypothetical protein